MDPASTYICTFYLALEELRKCIAQASVERLEARHSRNKRSDVLGEHLLENLDKGTLYRRDAASQLGR